MNSLESQNRKVWARFCLLSNPKTNPLNFRNLKIFEHSWMMMMMYFVFLASIVFLLA